MKKDLKLIVESSPEVEMVKTPYDPSKPKTMKFRGIFMQSSKRNGNGRVYDFNMMKEEVDRFRREMIETNRALMELEHPSSSEIDPTRASARILSMEEDSKQWIGEAVILCSDEKFGIKGTPCGDVLASLTNYGTKWGVSSRALGELNEQTGEVTEFHLVTCDTVMNPSIGEMVTADGDRFVNGILESKTFVCDVHGEKFIKPYDKFYKNLSHMPNTFISSKKNEKIAKAVSEFFNSLKQI